MGSTLNKSTIGNSIKTYSQDYQKERSRKVRWLMLRATSTSTTPPSATRSSPTSGLQAMLRRCRLPRPLLPLRHRRLSSFPTFWGRSRTTSGNSTPTMMVTHPALSQRVRKRSCLLSSSMEVFLRKPSDAFLVLIRVCQGRHFTISRRISSLGSIRTTWSRDCGVGLRASWNRYVSFWTSLRSAVLAVLTQKHKIPCMFINLCQLSSTHMCHQVHQREPSPCRNSRPND